MKIGKFVRGLAGVVCITIAVGGIFYWEAYGRQKYLYQEIISLNRDVMQGEIIKVEDISVVDVELNRLIPGFILDINDIVGKESKHFIPKNAQLHANYFDDKHVVLDEGEYILSLDSTLLANIPQTLRRKDTIFLYPIKGDQLSAYTEITDKVIEEVSKDTSNLIEFNVAYVKDSSGLEVTDISIDERMNSSAIIGSIEVVATEEKVNVVKEVIESKGKLIIIYKNKE